MDQPHQLLQRLRLELTHREDALVQPRAGSRPQGFLEGKTRLFFWRILTFQPHVAPQ